jgi:general stress protein 26
LRRLLAAYKRRIQRGLNTDLDHCLAGAEALARRARYAFLISHGAEGWPSARWVEPIVDFDSWEISIGTHPSLRKVHEVEANGQVTVAFGSLPDRANLVVYGEARIETDVDLRRRRWKGEWRMFFPGGPASDDYVLLQVKPKRMELMSFRSKIVPEPFGLKPVVLERRGNGWEVVL